MSHYCRICSRHLPNEKFSGKGHANHICKTCSKIPKEVIAKAGHLDNIGKMLRQSRISEKNIKYLEKLSLSPDPEIAVPSKVVLEIAKVRPFKKKRLKHLARERRDLIEGLEETGLIYAIHY